MTENDQIAPMFGMALAEEIDTTPPVSEEPTYAAVEYLICLYDQLKFQTGISGEWIIGFWGQPTEEWVSLVYVNRSSEPWFRLDGSNVKAEQMYELRPYMARISLATAEVRAEEDRIEVRTGV